jgi:uncharacterized protein YndB with AHSA1/START domain
MIDGLVSSDRELVLNRVFDAPRPLVWSVWTEARHVAEWWGPEGFTTRVTESDFRVGGRWRYVMVGPDGAEYPVTGVFLEITPLERIVSTDDFDEGFVEPEVGALPRGVVATVMFDDLGPKTRLTIRIAHQTAEDRRRHEEMGVVAGWQSSFDCMDRYLATLPRS